MEAVLVVLLAVVLVIIYHAFERFTCNVPGPWGLPLVGIYPFLGERPYEKLAEYAKKYGEIFQAKVGTIRVVLLNSEQAIQDLMSKWELSDRPELTCFHKLRKGSNSITIGMLRLSDQWLFLRKPGARSLKDFIVSPNSSVEPVCIQVAESLIRQFSEWPRHGASAKAAVFLAVNNMLGRMFWGKQFQARDANVGKNMQIVETSAKYFGVGCIIDYLPFLKPFLLQKLRNLEEFAEHTQSFLNDWLDSYKFNPDVVTTQDALEKIISTTKQQYGKLGLSANYIRSIFINFYTAGTVGMHEVFLMALKVCAICKDVQLELRMEIGKICVESSLERVTLECEKRMHYTRAFIDELMRFTTIMPLGIAHCSAKDIQYKGYNIPKGTVIMSNFWLLHNDPLNFPEPEKFDPTRFLVRSSSGFYDEYNADAASHLYAFGYGRRKCFAEQLVKKSMFLLITNIVRKFEISCEQSEGKRAFDVKPNTGLMRIWEDANLKFAEI